MNRCRGYRYMIIYHFAWAFQYHDVLTDNDQENLEKFFEASLLEKGIGCRNISITKDYVYLMLDCKPTHSISDLLKSLKGGSSRSLLKNNTELRDKTGGVIWDTLNIVGTSDDVLTEIKDYILEKQKRD